MCFQMKNVIEKSIEIFHQVAFKAGTTCSRLKGGKAFHKCGNQLKVSMPAEIICTSDLDILHYGGGREVH